MLKIAIITDIHNGPNRGSKKGSAAKGLFSDFSAWLTDSGCEFVVELGDRISDIGPEADKELIKEVGAWFADLTLPHYHLAGNHDLKSLSLTENEVLFNFQLDSQSFDSQGFHIVLWEPGSTLDQERGFALSKPQLQWLEQDLAATSLPTIIFTHVPLDNGSMKGNFYFEKAYPHHAHFQEQDGERIRAVIESSRKVVLCVNGHTHWNAYHCIDGIHYITVPSLTEMFTCYPQACGAWAKLTIADDIHLKVYGNLPAEYRLPLRSLNAHPWLNVDKDYVPQITTPQ